MTTASPADDVDDASPQRAPEEPDDHAPGVPGASPDES